MADLDPRQYPLPKPAEDPRFSFGLLLDVASAIEQHGYPKLAAFDAIELRQVLFGFLYAEPDGGDDRG